MAFFTETYRQRMFFLASPSTSNSPISIWRSKCGLQLVSRMTKEKGAWRADLLSSGWHLRLKRWNSIYQIVVCNCKNVGNFDGWKVRWTNPLMRDWILKRMATCNVQKILTIIPHSNLCINLFSHLAVIALHGKNRSVVVWSSLLRGFYTRTNALRGNKKCRSDGSTQVGI